MGRSKGNRPLGKPRHKWEDNIKMDLVVGCDAMNWENLAVHRCGTSGSMRACHAAGPG